MPDDPRRPREPGEEETRSGGGPPGPSPSRPEPAGGVQGKRLGDFELIRELGRGGMGIVYEARQVSLNRRIALKVLPPGLGLTPEARIRFEREAQAAAKLHHTNIVPVHAIGEQDGYHFYAMELVEGQSLSRILDDLRGGHANVMLDETLTVRPKVPGETREETPGPETTSGASTTGGREWFDTVARLVADVAEALDYAHGRGVIHRDIKPANLLFSRDGRLSIADFGLARVAQDPGMTISGSLLGSPAYMSPEQIAAGRMKLDHRTDVYSLGAVLYEMLTLKRPFPGETREEIVTGILTKEPKPARRWNSKIPLDLETICQKAMEKDPDRRYQTAGLLAQDLKQYLSRGLIAARRAGPLRRTTKWVRRHPVVSVVAAALMVVAIVAAFAVQQRFGRSEANARRLVSDAELRLREGTYREGLARVEEALTLTPGSLDAKKTKARLLLELRHDRELANLAKDILASHPDDWEAHAWLASAGRYGGLADIPAEEHVKAVERLAPNTAEAWRLKGLMTYSKFEAVKCFDRALELDPAHYWALIGRAEAYIGLKKFPEAVADAERAIVARPRSPRGRCLVADVYAYGFHDPERALSEYEKAIAIDPEDPVTYFQRSLVHFDLDSYDKYLEDTTRALDLEKKSFSSHLSVILAERAWALDCVGRLDESLSDARRAIEIEPQQWASYPALLDSLEMLKRREELRTAMGDLRKRADAWTDRKSAALTYVRMSDLHTRLGEHNEAVAAASRGIELDPEQALVGFAVRGYARRFQAGYAAAQPDCDLIARLEPKEPKPLRNRGWVLWFACFRADAALADYARLIAMAPAWADAYSERGTILFSSGKGQHREVLANFEKALQLAPRWALGFERRAWVYEDMEKWPQVLADLERYFALGGGNAYSRRSQATALAHLGREDEALAALDKAIREAPKLGDGYAYRADILFNLGRLDEALAALGKALEVEPEWAGWYLSRASYLAHKPGSCARAEDDLKRVRELAPNDPSLKIQEAMIRVSALGYTCPELARPARALELAREAMKFNPEDYDYLPSLGAALYANNRYEEAKAAFLGALDFQTKPLPRMLFLLAMTESKLDRQADARRTYARAVERMNQTWPKSPDLVLLKKEAGKVVGVR